MRTRPSTPSARPGARSGPASRSAPRRAPGAGPAERPRPSPVESHRLPHPARLGRPAAHPVARGQVRGVAVLEQLPRRPPGALRAAQRVRVEEDLAVAAPRAHAGQPREQRRGPRGRAIAKHPGETLAPVAAEVLQLARNEAHEALPRPGREQVAGRRPQEPFGVVKNILHIHRTTVPYAWDIAMAGAHRPRSGTSSRATGLP